MMGHTGPPPPRAFLSLAALVLGAHLLVLQVSPNRVGTDFASDSALVPVFSTRSITPAAPAAELPPKPAPRQAKSAAPSKKQENQAGPLIKPAPDASYLIASEAPPLGPQSAQDAAATAQPSSPESVTPTGVSSLPTNAGTTPTLSASGPTLPPGPKTTPVTAVVLPPSMQLQYKVTGFSKGLTYQANAELEWDNGGAQYSASMKVSALFIGSRSMTSNGQITPTGLAPNRFADKFKSEQAAHFQADQGKITFSANTADAPWIEGAQDRVSVFLQLGGLLAARPEDFPPGSEISLYTVGPREADTWTFIVGGQERISLPGGDQTAVRLARKPRREFDQTVEIWFAPALGYLPVRSRITQQNGDFIDQILSSVVRR